jgi:transcription initiation factor IIE alpha subunit
MKYEMQVNKFLNNIKRDEYKEKNAHFFERIKVKRCFNRACKSITYNLSFSIKTEKCPFCKSSLEERTLMKMDVKMYKGENLDTFGSPIVRATVDAPLRILSLLGIFRKNDD